MFKKSETIKVIAKSINNEVFFERRVKNMSNDLNSAKELVDNSIEHLSLSIDKLLKMEETISEGTKKVSGKVRDASKKLNDGLTNIEKTANFDRLERYVSLLERAEKSLGALAELENNGQLEKIANAIR